MARKPRIEFKISSDPSTLVGVSKMAEIFGESKHWARTILKQWLAEQQKGGPLRVFAAGKKGALFTTITVLQREMPPTRDRYVTKKLAEHDRDLDDLARKLASLINEVNYLRKLVKGPQSFEALPG